MGAERQVDEEIEVEFDPVEPIMTQPSQIELLLKTVESELIPRLFVSHMVDVPASSRVVQSQSRDPVPGPWSSEEAVEAFAMLCLENDPRKLDRHVTDLLAGGVMLESVFLFLLAPAARHLGDRWLEDEVSFVDVQLALCRLHQLICECEAVGYRSENMPVLNHSILLTSAPGEDHTFGVTMVADFFRRYGWHVSNLCGLDLDFLIARISSTYYNAVGFSLHSEDNFNGLGEVITRIRSISTNRQLVVMVGGDYFIRNPADVKTVGADIFATDGHEAVLLATNASQRGGVEV